MLRFRFSLTDQALLPFLPAFMGDVTGLQSGSKLPLPED